MLPIYKLFSLVMRVFSRPLINYTKKWHIANQSNENNYLKKFFVRFGNFYHKTEMIINRKFLKIQSTYTYKPLNDQLALEKGIEFFYEMIVYLILIGFPIFEMYVASVEAQEKKKEMTKRLNSFDIKSAILEQSIKNLVQKLKKVQFQYSEQIEELNDQIIDIQNKAKKEKLNAQIQNQVLSAYTKIRQQSQKTEYCKDMQILNGFINPIKNDAQKILMLI